MFDAIGVVCSDLNRSVRFYQFFGLQFQSIGSGEHFEAVSESGVRIMLDSVQLAKQLNPDFEKPKGSGVVLCFKQPSAAAVDGLVAQLVQAGFTCTKDPWDAFWGQRYASVLDPDGNQVDIFAAL